jgi:2-polyprenyl-6-methoxyphenol hydroxylase-like FAD-dependent oxidoreductase
MVRWSDARERWTGSPCRSAIGSATVTNAARCFQELVDRPVQNVERQRLVRRAVVIGGGFAGLLAARVLHDIADKVVLLDPDELRPDREPRTGVPQASQLHVLLGCGRDQLERWLPGTAAALDSAGAVRSVGDRVSMYLDGRRKPTVPGYEILGATRPLLESTIRRRVLALPRVEAVVGTALGLRIRKGWVSGVVVDRGHRRILAEDADIVVDASGRSSRVGFWLSQAGFPKPEVERIPIDLGYATAQFRRPLDWRGPTAAQHVVRQGVGRRASVAALAATEGDRWTVLLSGYAADRPDADLGSFRARAADLSVEFAAAVAGDAIGAVRTYHQSDSRRRRFHRLNAIPEGLFVVGDALASFNPVYGQGMSVATLHASALQRHLLAADAPVAAFYAEAEAIVEAAWSVTAVNDRALPHVTSEATIRDKIISVAMDVLLDGSAADADLHRRFLDVADLRAHPDSLKSPSVLLRAALLRRRRSAVR